MSANETKRLSLPKFLKRGKIGSYLTVVMSGQIPYSSFEAFKGALLLPLCAMLGITEGQFGTLMGWIGIAMFLYVPGGWINNRFQIKHILVAWCSWRFVTYMILFLVPNLSFTIMVGIAISWAVWDAIGWPAVVNGVSFIASDENSKGRGLAMGLLETIRRASEMLMNLLIVGLIAWRPESKETIMWIFALAYAFLLIPMVIALLKLVPSNAIAHEESHSDNLAALIGLFKVLTRPRVWLAALSAMCVYWAYVHLIYASAPYMTIVFKASDGIAGAFGIFNTGLVGVFAGLVSGVVADYIFKSSTVMMGVSLTIITIGAGLVYVLPVNESSMWISMVLLMIMAVGVFMGKAVILAPIAELHLPPAINGSAMAVGSFLAYAPVFWANPWAGKILEEANKATSIEASAPLFGQLFLITILVAAFGAVCAFTLAFFNKKAEQVGSVHED